MELDLVRADVRMAEHRARVAAADRLGSLRWTRDARAASRRSPIVAVTSIVAVPQVVETALRRLGARLRGSPHLTAAGGVGPSDG